MTAAVIHDVPVDPGRLAAGAGHLARDDRLAAIGPGPGHPEWRAGVRRQPGAVGMGDIVAEQAGELLLLLRREAVRVLAEHEAGDALHVEVGVEQLAET